MTSDAALPPLTGGARTRARILDAAAGLMNTVGLTRTTTKEIARAAGCSEAALYKHFRDKEEICISVLRERGPRLSDALAELSGRAGQGEVAEHLEGVAREALDFYREVFPMAASLFASQDLLTAHRRKIDQDAGPHQVTHHLAGYLCAEQQLGRISPTIDPSSAAGLLLGACFHRAFLTLFFAGEAPAGALRPESEEEFVTEAVRSLLEGAGPRRRGAQGVS